MTIKHLGLAEVFECSQCKERYVGPPSDKQTKTWQKSHREYHTDKPEIEGWYPGGRLVK